MKIKIESNPSMYGGFFWQVRTPHGITFWPKYEGAAEYVRKYIKRYTKESNAYSMLSTVSMNYLQIRDFIFLQKLKGTKCKGITSKQYGYLKGIYERQQREW